MTDIITRGWTRLQLKKNQEKQKTFQLNHFRIIFLRFVSITLLILNWLDLSEMEMEMFSFRKLNFKIIWIFTEGTLFCSVVNSVEQKKR